MALNGLISTIGIALSLGALTEPVLAQTPETLKHVISTPNAPKANGPYSQGIRAGSFVFLAGQLGVDPATNQLVKDAGIEEQTRRTLENLKAVLEADGLTMDHIVSTTVFMNDATEFAKMNAVYATFFKVAPPARTTVEVTRFPREGAKVEITAIAIRP
jgi:2-iminobutanoate/2-iminopropanoate deaminase